MKDCTVTIKVLEEAKSQQKSDKEEEQVEQKTKEKTKEEAISVIQQDQIKKKVANNAQKLENNCSLCFFL